MDVQLFGIRHHGPGCARSLIAALESYEPDSILVEGPPDASDILPLASADGMRPPVAILIYPPEKPHSAAFYPFAEFSPEWQTIRFAHARQVPIQFMDLPQANQLAMIFAAQSADSAEFVEATSNKDGESPNPDAANEETSPANCPSTEQLDHNNRLHDDPIGALAMAAGYSDRELWWEHQIEQRQDPSGLFQGIMEAMTVLRTESQSPSDSDIAARTPDHRRFEAHREAYMRQQIRQARRDGANRLAVVCGAWHAPAIASLGPAKADAELLRGLPKTTVTATWAPWSFSRLAARSGYGAGVTSPGWYDHLWRSSGNIPSRWIIKAARLLRKEGLDASSACVIEAVRLSEALAALRDLPMPGLRELTEAIFTVLCHGQPAPLALIRDKLEIGERLGNVPSNAPAVPLQRDLESLQKRLRLPRSTEIKTLDLDLRKENDRERSRLLHRLNLLGISWGKPLDIQGKAGTFHELWQLQWQVEFAVAIIEASIWGSTVESAAANIAADRVGKSTTVADVTSLLDQTILAALPAAIDSALARLDEIAAIGADICHLMEGLPPLARVVRYGDVRDTPTERLKPVIANFLTRIFVGLPAACSSLDEQAAAQMVTGIGFVQECLCLLDEVEQRADWRNVLRRIMCDDAIHGLVCGWCCRVLLDDRALADGELLEQTSLALSSAVEPARAGAWIEGLLRGTGMVLLHEDQLWQALDRWLIGLKSETFIELLPVLRRAVAGFQPPERRAMGEKVKHLALTSDPQRRAKVASDGPQLDPRRVELVLPVLAEILGVSLPLLTAADAAAQSLDDHPVGINPDGN